MKKVGYYVGLVASSLALLAGCANTSTKDSKASESKSGKTEISYAIWDSAQEPGIRKIADKFEEKNPKIKVNIQVVSWDAYWTMLEAGATGGSLPDTFWMHSNEIYRYGSNKMLLPLDDYIKKSKDVKLSNYPKGLSKIYNVKGSQYAVPKDYDTIGLWYNKKMFDQAGISYPDETWTWDTLKENAKKLTKPDGSQYGFLAPLHNQEGYYNFVYQNGGTIITKDKKSGYDNPKTVEALKYYLSFVKEKLSPEVTEDKKRAEVMQNGQVAMGYFGSWNLSAFALNDYMKENFDVAVLPKANDGKQSTIFNGLGNAISAKTKHKEASWKWVEYLGSKEGQDMQAELGVAISAYKGSDKVWVNSNKTFAIKHFVDMVDYAQIRPYSNATSKWEDKAYEELKPAYLGKESLETASKKITKTMNKALEQEK
ncbi:sugar ABC transporter substrate-binding protein [Streptococcus didelphis]|uniref:Sugar ABC transporter substrate-binding protein n=1 Tax=Streptococcus didelphis TaxID=102886 RepID=A0ABY9LGJ0_9STRE|nr:sugar ABC transporter substrate-binding protein [Streptococcus didelphis]WMB27978.1 sugar ABC transporter substrate-binding protein [Streptococcus didelphis]